MEMKRSIKMLLILAAVFLLQGCWDKRELTDLALISALGVDKGENTKYEATFQVVNPISVTGGLQGGQGGDRPPITTITVPGNNLTEISRHASTSISRELYYSHTNLVVVDEDLAKDEGLVKILDILDRDTNFRTTSTIVIAHGAKAKDLIKALTPVDKIPANKINKTLQFTEQQLGEHFKTSIQDVLKCITSQSRYPVISSFKLTGIKKKAPKMESIQSTDPAAQIEANDLAVFKEGKLADWLEGQNARSVLWLRNKVRQSYLTIDLMNKKDSLTFDVIRQNTKVKAKLKNNQPAISVYVNMEGDVGETTVPVLLDDPKVLNEIEKKASDKLKKELQDAVKLVQQRKTDVLQFGDVVYRRYPEVWKKIEHQWADKYFPDLDVEITVNAYVRRTGLRSNPGNLKGS